jgi:hypothetical protein
MALRTPVPEPHYRIQHTFADGQAGVVAWTATREQACIVAQALCRTDGGQADSGDESTQSTQSTQGAGDRGQATGRVPGSRAVLDWTR